MTTISTLTVQAVSNPPNATPAPTMVTIDGQPVTTLYEPDRAVSDIAARVAQLMAVPSLVVRSYGGNSAALRADQAPLADQLIAEFGSMIHLTVGNFAYPLDPLTARNVCRPFRLASSTVEGLRATVELAGPSVVSGADFSATVTVTNVGPDQVVVDGADPLTAVILRHGTSEMVAAYDGNIGGTGIGLNLKPGASHAISVHGGTASCDPAPGAALPPGTYDVVVMVLGPAVSGSEPELMAGPIPLIVAAR